jgi:hypothetical protein
LLVDCKSHLILAAVPGVGPSPDVTHLVEAIHDADRRQPIDTLLADAGYDAEWVHEFVRGELGIGLIAPPKAGRPTAKPPTGRFRKQMWRYFQRPPDQRRYGQRWQVETVFSVIKRHLGETRAARQHPRQDRAIMLKVITHNVMIVRSNKVFYGATCVSVPPMPCRYAPLILRHFSCNSRCVNSSMSPVSKGRSPLVCQFKCR